MKRVIGITGGVGSGKSRVLDILKTKYQAEVIQADLVAAELEQPGRPGLKLLVEAFGSSILDRNGYLDRKAFAARIFADAKAVELVNAIIHPLTYQEMQRRIDASPSMIVAVEAALFDEKHAHMCDEMWFIDTDEEIRITRLMEGRGYTREKCLDIMAHQASRDFFLSLSDKVIDNNGTTEDVERQIASCLEELPRKKDKA